MTDERGWNALIRVRLHLQQKEHSADWLPSLNIVEYCRRLVLADWYPESDDIKRLVEELHP